VLHVAEAPGQFLDLRVDITDTVVVDQRLLAFELAVWGVAGDIMEGVGEGESI
jgi:hypothetical protein